MYYAPHILEKRIENNFRDEYGRMVKSESTWVEVCRCRCDNNETRFFESENGKTYTPKYHVVCEGRADVLPGDYVRCRDGEGIRGEGEVFRFKPLNYLQYSELWM